MGYFWQSSSVSLPVESIMSPEVTLNGNLMMKSRSLLSVLMARTMSESPLTKAEVSIEALVTRSKLQVDSISVEPVTYFEKCDMT